MKNLFSYVFRAVPKKVVASAVILAAALVIPISTVTAAAVQIEGSMGVANVTAGNTTYAPSVNATYDQVVKFQVYYHNTENPDSGKIAENLRVKITIPNQAGAVQTASTTISGDNTNVVNAQSTVNINRSDATLEYIPGSAVWRHNIGDNTNINYVETAISDAVVTSGQGLVLENEKPCFNFAATVTVMARVKVPGISVDKQVRVKGTTTWTTNNTANPGDTLEYMITYKNMGNTQQNNVVIRDNLPPKMSLVPGTTYLKNTTNPNGVLYNSDAVTAGGIVVGNYSPGAAAYVKFEVKVPSADQLTCGANEFRNVGVAKPEGMNEYYNTAITTVTKSCGNQPTYTCNLLTVEKTGGRGIKTTINYTATNGATFSTATINFGDGSQNLVTNQTTANHTYAKDGYYTVSATLTFMVNGVAHNVNSNACTQTVSFGTPPPNIPATGPTETIALFIGTIVAGAIGYRLWMIRRLGN